MPPYWPCMGRWLFRVEVILPVRMGSLEDGGFGLVPLKDAPRNKSGEEKAAALPTRPIGPGRPGRSLSLDGQTSDNRPCGTTVPLEAVEIERHISCVHTYERCFRIYVNSAARLAASARAGRTSCGGVRASIVAGRLSYFQRLTSMPAAAKAFDCVISGRHDVGSAVIVPMAAGGQRLHLLGPISMGIRTPRLSGKVLSQVAACSSDVRALPPERVDVRFFVDVAGSGYDNNAGPGYRWRSGVDLLVEPGEEIADHVQRLCRLGLVRKDRRPGVLPAGQK